MLLVFNPRERCQSENSEFCSAYCSGEILDIECALQPSRLRAGSESPLVLLASLGNTAHIFNRFGLKLTAKHHFCGTTRSCIRWFKRSLALWRRDIFGLAAMTAGDKTEYR
jgi:hypothetical protein